MRPVAFESEVVSTTNCMTNDKECQSCTTCSDRTFNVIVCIRGNQDAVSGNAQSANVVDHFLSALKKAHRDYVIQVVSSF